MILRTLLPWRSSLPACLTPPTTSSNPSSTPRPRSFRLRPPTLTTSCWRTNRLDVRRLEDLHRARGRRPTGARVLANRCDLSHGRRTALNPKSYHCILQRLLIRQAVRIDSFIEVRRSPYFSKRLMRALEGICLNRVAPQHFSCSGQYTTSRPHRAPFLNRSHHPQATGESPMNRTNTIISPMPPLSFTPSINKRNALMITAAIVASLFPATAGAGGQASGDLQEKLAAVKQSAAENQKKLHQYQWVETVQLKLNGDTKPGSQSKCQYGPDGKVQKTPIGPPPQAPKGSSLKQRIIAKKRGQIRTYMIQVRTLL